MLPKPYSEYVGRSTTPLRAILALLAGNILAPFLVGIIYLAPNGFQLRAEGMLSIGEFLMPLGWFTLVGTIFVAPFLWVGGGLLWMFAHGMRKNGPIAAISSAIVVSTVGVFVLYRSLTLPWKPALTSSEWLNIGWSALLINLAACLTSLVIWAIAYRGRPKRPTKTPKPPTAAPPSHA